MFTNNGQLKQLTGYVDIEDVISYCDNPKIPIIFMLTYIVIENSQAKLYNIAIRKTPVYDESSKLLKMSCREEIEKFYKNRPEGFYGFSYGNKNIIKII